MMRSFFVLALLLCSFGLSAQEFEVPKKYKFKKKEDYIRHEKDILSCIAWMESTPFDLDDKKRKKAVQFFLDWLNGNPKIKKFEPSSEIQLVFIDKNPELLVIFYAGWAKFVLEHPEQADDKLQTNMAGMLSIIKVYKMSKDNGLKKDKAMETVIKMWEKGELQAWVDKNK
ncbi:MAG: hypothetical protein ACKOXB_09970 [Flavobacteriales bacterium]